MRWHGYRNGYTPEVTAGIRSGLAAASRRSSLALTMRRRPLLNLSEGRAHRLLVRTLTSTGWNVAIKPPVQAVLDKEHDDLAMDEFRLYTQGHFDFAIYSEDDPLAAFAIEFDGFGHDQPDQIARDIIKNRLCARAALALLRVGSAELREIEQVTVLEWIVERFTEWHRERPEIERRIEEEVRRLPPDDPILSQMRRTGFADPAYDSTFLFDLEHPFPPNAAVAERLRTRFGIRVDSSLLRYNDDAGIAAYALRLPRQIGGTEDGAVSEFATCERRGTVTRLAPTPTVIREVVGRARFAAAHKTKAPGPAGGSAPSTTVFPPPGVHGSGEALRRWLETLSPGELQAFSEYQQWVMARITSLDMTWLPATSPDDIVEQLSLYDALRSVELWASRNLVDLRRAPTPSVM